MSESFEILDSNGRLLFRGNRQNLMVECLLGKVFADANLSHLSGEGLRFDGATFICANFMYSDLYWASFIDCNLENANFYYADLRGAQLDNADLRAANFQYSNCGTDSIGGSTSFADAILCGANFLNTNLEGAIFNGAVYDDRTVFPASFNARERGLRKAG